MEPDQNRSRPGVKGNKLREGEKEAPRTAGTVGAWFNRNYKETLNMEKNIKSSAKRQGFRAALLCRPGIGWGWYLHGQRITYEEAAALLLEVKHVS